MVRKPTPQQQASMLVAAFKAHGVRLPLGNALDLVARQNGHKNWNVMSAAMATEPGKQAPSAAPTGAAKQTETQPDLPLLSYQCDPDSADAIAQVVRLRPDLYATEATGVLQECKKSANSTGPTVTLDALKDTADDMFPEHRSVLLRAVDEHGQRWIELDLANARAYCGESLADQLMGDGLELPARREALRPQGQLEALSLMALPPHAQVFHDSQFVCTAQELADPAVRRQLLRQLGEPRLMEPAATHLGPYMAFTVQGNGAHVDAAGLYQRLQGKPLAQLSADSDAETAAASGAAEALSAFTLALCAQGVDVGHERFVRALDETLESLANAIA